MDFVSLERVDVSQKVKKHALVGRVLSTVIGVLRTVAPYPKGFFRLENNSGWVQSKVGIT